MEFRKIVESQCSDIVWDTVSGLIRFDIRPGSVGSNKRIVVKNVAGKILLQIEKTSTEIVKTCYR